MKRWPVPGKAALTGGLYLLALGASLLPPVQGMEQMLHQQMQQLRPQAAAIDTSARLVLPLWWLLLTLGFSWLCLEICRINRRGPSLAFLLLSAFAMLMAEILLELFADIWLPLLWPAFSLFVAGLLLMAWQRRHWLRDLFSSEPSCRIEEIRDLTAAGDHAAAVFLLKNCPFSDDMFELAYELGQKIEAEKNWLLARYLYQWLVQFDPGIQDFVDHVEAQLHPQRLSDLGKSTETAETAGEEGEIFGHYRILGRKATGATAEVVEARDLNTHRRVALKLLNQKLDDSTGERDIMTFLHEAMTVSSLDHPNIVKIHDADIIDDRAYIAMDFIDGYPLSARLKRKRYLTAAESLRVMRAVLEALIAAHRKGIVHGDIKPANIMFDRATRRYIVTDFGAAWSRSRLPDAGSKIIGTPSYMSPEQLSGKRLDGRSDLFSLAVTIYHLLSGYQPFVAEDLKSVKRLVCGAEVDLDRLKIPESIRQVIGKALQKKTYQRFADAEQMLQAVEHCEQLLGKSSPSP